MINNLSTTYLPNNKEVFCLRSEEAEVLYEQVQDYIKHNITLKEGDTVFDVGANIGLFSLMVNDLCKGKANIYAFEPIPWIYEALQLNGNRFNPSKIKTFQIGLGHRSEIIDFSYYPNATALSSSHPDSSGEEKQQFAITMKENIQKLFPPFNLIAFLPEPLVSFAVDRLVDFVYWEQKVRCEIKTISEFILEQSIEKIDLLKIDVEKAELDVLAGIKDEDWSKIQQIVVEVHNLNNRVETIVNLLKSKGFLGITQVQDPLFKTLDIYNVYATKTKSTRDLD